MITIRQTGMAGTYFVYLAHVCFIEVSPGIYRVGKSKTGLYSKEEFYSTPDVIQALNTKGLHVTVCKGDLEHPDYCNFKIDPQRLGGEKNA